MFLLMLQQKVKLNLIFSIFKKKYQKEGSNNI